MNTVMTVSFVAYILVVVSIAFFAYRVTNNFSDFVLGGRQLGGAVAALSAGASDMSAWLVMGLPGAVFSKGLSQVWVIIGLSVGAYLGWRVVARPLRVYTEMANDALTLPAYLDNRFFDTTRSIRVIAALVLLVFFAIYTASGLVGGATVLQRLFGCSYQDGLLIGTVIIVAYTFIGGFLAVSWTDFLQGTFMLITLLVVPWIAMQLLGGFEETYTVVDQLHPFWFYPSKGITFLGIVNALAWGLGYFGQPHILVRYMAVRSLPDIIVARRIGISWMMLSLAGATATGCVGVAYFHAQTLANPESVFIHLSFEVFPPALAGVILAAILSSIMCALDSQLLSSSSAVAEDIYHPFLRKKAQPKELMWVSRLAILLTAAVALYLARDPSSRVLDLVSFAWAGLGASFGPVVVASLFWRRMTVRGAVWGMCVGAVSVILWHAYRAFWIDFYEIIPGYAFASLAVVLGSYLDKKPSQKTVALYDKVWGVLKNG